MNFKLFITSATITATVLTGALLMPFAEYNSSRYIIGETGKLTEFSFDETALTVGLFGEAITLPTQTLKSADDTLKRLLPTELRICERLIQRYMGEAIFASP